MPEILPSLLAADFARLADQIALAEAGGATVLHYDVMDGHFVPNISMGPPVLASIRKVSRSFLDVHLMVSQPDLFLGAFADAGADSLIVHQETCPHLDRTLGAIKKLGLKAGVALNPATPIATLTEVLEVADLVLVMSVNPGFGGQAFIPRTLAKTRALRAIRAERGLSFLLEMDGGLGAANVAECAAAGCDWMVCGTSVFGAGVSGNPDPAGAVRELTRLARAV
ncbi:MAG: ribulose-phosphate 3-epimerase [Acidobacteria bacterium]|nr:ribulose-phosphate 3-epimerase [Acidobacteriota bacterium]